MKILFQGDSVTDSGRDRSNPHDMGDGYCRYASAMIQDSFPDGEFEFVNLGIGGNRTENLVERLEADFVDIQPDIVSVMIGVNDVWHHYAVAIETTDEAFEHNLRTVLTAIRTRTSAKLLLIQPYLLEGDFPQDMKDELARKLAIVKQMADEFADAYLPMNDIFHHESVELTAYSEDGVHPNADGAIFIAEAYLKAVTPLIEAVAAKDEQEDA